MTTGIRRAALVRANMVVRNQADLFPTSEVV